MSYNVKNWRRGGYAEESHSIRMTLAERNDKDLNCIFRSFSCKDFLQDWYFHERTDKPMSIYSFKSVKTDKGFDEKYLIIDINPVMTSLTTPLENSIRFMSNFVENPEVEMIKEGGSTFLTFNFDKSFLNHFYGVSLYTLLVRTAPYYDEKYNSLKEFFDDMSNIKQIAMKDRGYLSKVKDFVLTLSETKTFPDENYDKIINSDNGTIHHRSGVVNYVAGTIK